jgi:hypothetical protein
MRRIVFISVPVGVVVAGMIWRRHLFLLMALIGLAGLAVWITRMIWENSQSPMANEPKADGSDGTDRTYSGDHDEAWVNAEAQASLEKIKREYRASAGGPAGPPYHECHECQEDVP